MNEFFCTLVFDCIDGNPIDAFTPFWAYFISGVFLLTVFYLVAFKWDDKTHTGLTVILSGCISLLVTVSAYIFFWLLVWNWMSFFVIGATLVLFICVLSVALRIRKYRLQ